MKTIPVGTRFTIYGLVADGVTKRYHGLATVREKMADGSRVISQHGTGDTFTTYRAAEKWSGDMNTAEGDRVAVVS